MRPFDPNEESQTLLPQQPETPAREPRGISAPPCTSSRVGEALASSCRQRREYFVHDLRPTAV
jgi:hypothetical protein